MTAAPASSSRLVTAAELMRARFRPVVTDHAVVRWMERVRGEGAFLEEVRREVLDGDRGFWIARGVLALTQPELGVELIAEQGRVITIQPIARRR